MTSGRSIYGASLTTVLCTYCRLAVFLFVVSEVRLYSKRFKKDVIKNGRLKYFYTEDMAKGRRFVPSKEKEGHWYKSRGWTTQINPTVEQDLTIVPPAPEQFEKKAESPYKHFMFSKHDNRHDLQDHGVYFGNGLGKRFLPGRSQHYSNNMITWNMNNDHRSNYTASYRGRTADGAQCRRYPKVHPEGKPGTAPLSTTTTQWFKGNAFMTPLHVMASTQEPLLPPNSWIYSYRPNGHIWS